MVVYDFQFLYPCQVKKRVVQSIHFGVYLPKVIYIQLVIETSAQKENIIPKSA